jgi:hypothetical protein
MHLSRISQMSAHDVQNTSLDLLVSASGYESRATHVALRFGRTARRKVCLGFEERRTEPQRIANDELYASLGFEALLLAAGDEGAAENTFSRLFRDLDTSTTPAVGIDISSMTRAWYGSFIRYLHSQNDCERVRTFFFYAPARFQKPSGEYPQNRFVGPVTGFSGLALPHRPTSLIVGLGHDAGRALGVHEELDPGISASFLARPSVDLRYERSTLLANADFLDLVPPDLQFDYPLLDFLTTYHRLSSVSRSLSRTSRVVIAPVGPKPFALVSLLVAISHPEVSVWRVSAGERELAINRAAAGPILIAETAWERSVSIEENVEADVLELV